MEIKAEYKGSPLERIEITYTYKNSERATYITKLMLKDTQYLCKVLEDLFKVGYKEGRYVSDQA